jgi:hypothetical protein
MIGGGIAGAGMGGSVGAAWGIALGVSAAGIVWWSHLARGGAQAIASRPETQ